MDHNSDRARQRMRANHQVRLVQSHEEGTAAADLPSGVYGFTGSPGLAAPLFASKRYRNFEVHRRHGDVAIVGFVSTRDAARLAQAVEPIDVTIYPDPEGDATEIIAIGYHEIAQHRQYSIRNALGLSLRVRSQASAAHAHPHQQTGPRVSR